MVEEPANLPNHPEAIAFGQKFLGAGQRQTYKIFVPPRGKVVFVMGIFKTFRKGSPHTPLQSMFLASAEKNFFHEIKAVT